ncbi:MAG: metallophosphoesterase family protein [Chloroflexi bacterium]|nr:metallophosphoesterase family protein [Chloroflexota bacterium]
MRYAILADIHSNLEAFQAVIEDLSRRGGYQKILCLGDIVGYGPDPHACIELLKSNEHLCVAGNHDLAAVGAIDTRSFNPVAEEAARWTSQHLSEADRLYLGQLPLRAAEGRFTLVHGSPREPVWEYITSAQTAAESLAHFDTPYCLVGHTHVSAIFRCVDEKHSKCFLEDFPIDEGFELPHDRTIMNPGSVGQPRDWDPTASYAILDTEEHTIVRHRTPYDVAHTQEKMRRAGLPGHLIVRLNYGR